MGIPHLTLDLRERFRAAIVNDFLDGHAAGRTPNPCVRCNGEVRFDAMLDLAASLGAGRLATGHYARVVRDEGGPLLREGADPRKDQSYMLARLDPEQLERLSFPLGGLTKDAVRALARAAGLPVADRRESQDLCFAAGLGSRAFLRRHGAPATRRPGRIVHLDGRRLGEHDGQDGFTVGQRRGLGVADGEPLYVVAKDAATATVTVGPRWALAATRVRLAAPSLHRGAGGVETARLRYGSAAIACRAVETADGGVELALERPAEAVAPGQLACLMAGDRVTGHGTIAEAW
jgi:tRNA-specific 2-thiouridylase